jgi:hypothetical protein
MGYLVYSPLAENPQADLMIGSACRVAKGRLPNLAGADV